MSHEVAAHVAMLIWWDSRGLEMRVVVVMAGIVMLGFELVVVMVREVGLSSSLVVVVVVKR